MDTLQAFACLDRWSPERRAATMPGEYDLDGADIWAACAVAACDVAGMLDDAKTDQDLEAGLSHFASLHGAGVVGDQDLQAAALDVLRAVLERGEAVEVLRAAESN